MLNTVKMVVWHVASPVSYAIPNGAPPSKKNPGSAPVLRENVSLILVFT